MPFQLPSTNQLNGEGVPSDYVRWLEDEDPSVQEERQSLQMLQNSATTHAQTDRPFEPLD